MTTPKTKTKPPITLILGLAGAGKSAVLTQLRRNQTELKLSILTNDRPSDSNVVENWAAGRTTELWSTIDYLVIESFELTAGDRSIVQLSPLIRTVTVVDAGTFQDDYNNPRPVNDAIDQRIGHALPTTITDLLVRQIEIADVIVLNKIDLVRPAEALVVEAIIKTINPYVDVFMATHGRVPFEQIVNTNLCAFKSVQHCSDARDKRVTGEIDALATSTFVTQVSPHFESGKPWTTYLTSPFH